MDPPPPPKKIPGSAHDFVANKFEPRLSYMC